VALVLIVEDSSFQRKIIIQIIEKAGHKTLATENGKKGLEVLEANTPDCIFCDLLMPEMDGFEFLAALKAKNISIPVINLTSDIQDTVKQKCLDLGAKGFLNKPAQEPQILAALNSVLS
jgi:two-component system, chemotaxis family, chemotaxis protein CheY